MKSITVRLNEEELSLLDEMKDLKNEAINDITGKNLNLFTRSSIIRLAVRDLYENMFN